MRARPMGLCLLMLSIWFVLGGCSMNLPFGNAGRTKRMKLETLIEAKGFFTTEKVLLVDIDGILTDGPVKGGFFSRASTLVHLKDILKQAEKNRSIRALLVRVNSPGGAVTASDLLYTELERFKEKTKKKIVVVCMGVAASGGYYLAMAADVIYAHPTTITGSIGVIGVFPSLEGLSDKIGFGMRIVKSGAFKDMGSMWRPFSQEEAAVLQEMIDSLYERFLKVVGDGRPGLDAETIRNLADGRVYTAQGAKKAGLIDKIGYIEDAFEEAKSICGIEDASLVVYRHPLAYKGHYYATAPAPATAGAALGTQGGTQINLFNLDMGRVFSPANGPFFYLWVP